MQREGKWKPSLLVSMLVLVSGVGCGQTTESSEVAELLAQVEELEAQVLASTTTEAPTTTTAPTTTKAAVGVTTSDVAIEYIVLDESCFSSAGSSMEIEMFPVLPVDSSLSVDDFANLRLLVTFDITNTEGGVTRGSFEIDRGMFNNKNDYLSFERCNTLPNIVVTGVTER